MFTVIFTLHKYDSDLGECRGLDGLMPGGCHMSTLITSHHVNHHIIIIITVQHFIIDGWMLRFSTYLECPNTFSLTPQVYYSVCEDGNEEAM